MKIFLLVTLFALATASTGKRATARQLATFSGFAENIAIRENGHILVTSLSTPSVQYLNPSGSNATIVLPPIPGANGVSGIVELKKDLFAVAAGIWNTTKQRETNASVWTVDFRRSSPTHVVLEKILDVPETTALNGFTVIPGTSIVLGADSAVGAIYAIDVAKRTYSITIQDSDLAPPNPSQGLGVNGIKVYGSELYFANSGKGIFGKLPISHTGTATGPPQAISQFNESWISGIDDFSIDDDGNAYIAVHPNTIYKVNNRGQQEVIVSGDEILDPTSVALGRRRKKGRKVIYASVNIIEPEIDHSVGGAAIIYL